MRLPWAERRGTVVEVQFVGRIRVGDGHKHPPKTIELEQRGVTRGHTFEEHCLEFPLSWKRLTPVNLDRLVPGGFGNHVVTPLPLKHERIREVIVALQHGRRLRWTTRRQL